jgi:hypothetical protein
VSKVNEGTVNYVLNGGVGSSKTNKSFRTKRKLLRRLIPIKTRKVGPVFIVEKKVTTSENADS